MTPQQFVEKWSRVELSERSASQQHFIDLCRLLGQPAPADHDATGAECDLEKWWNMRSEIYRNLWLTGPEGGCSLAASS